MSNKPLIDYEIYPYVSKSRRFWVELFELLLTSIATLLLFAFATVNIYQATPSYQKRQEERIACRNELYEVGKQSHLVRMYNEDTALDTYAMYIRYCYRQIHLSYELYPESFEASHIHEITDPYNEPKMDQNNDELLYFYTDYAIKKNIIVTENPVDNYLHRILDLEKHNNILVYNETLKCLTLNPNVKNGDTTSNFGVLLYTEIKDDNKNTAMNAMYKFYKEYYDQANRLLETSEDYKIAYNKYENASLKVSNYISYGYIFTYLFVALSYYLIMPMIRKDGVTPMKRWFSIMLTNSEGNYVVWYKKLIYYLVKALLGFFFTFFIFYFGYGLDFFSYPLFFVGNYAVNVLFIIVPIFIIWLANTISIFFPSAQVEKNTALEYFTDIRHADLRIDEDDERSQRHAFK